MGLAGDLSSLYFRGEYWRAPDEYKALTKNTIYSVPKHPEYPFLDPHWIVRANGEVEVGPNAVPISGPDAYDWSSTLRRLPRFLFELLSRSTLRVFMNPEFLSLASAEWRSSLSKNAMIERVRVFLPSVNPQAFTQRGFAGIRSVLLDRKGKFLDDAVILHGQDSLHILNYNSPGATGALPMGAMVSSHVLSKVTLGSPTTNKGLWDLVSISESMHA